LRFIGFCCVKAGQKLQVRAPDSFTTNPSVLKRVGELQRDFQLRPGLKLNNWLIFQTTALGFMMLASGMNGLGAPSIPNIAPEIIEIRETLPSGNEKILIKKSLSVEEYIRNYFSDIPVMIEIAKCESRFRQHDKDGEVLRGEKNDLDRGVMQINEYFHNENSEKLGFNILTLEGNTSYARYLFEKYGVKPWASSSRCWAKTSAYSDYKKELASNKEELAMK
jgi:hypothetical protein